MIRVKRGVKYILAAIAGVLSCVAGSPNAGAQVNAEQVMNIGRNVLSMDDYMLAIQYFNQAIKAKPYLSDPYYLRAVAKLYLDDYRGAEEDCSLAIERNKFKTEAYKLRGFARQNLGKDSLAIIDYDKGLEYNPHDKYFLFYKGVAQTQTKQYERADSTFALLLRHYPRFEEGYAELGRMNLLRGDTIKAIENIDHSIAISKNLVNCYLMRAEIHANRSEWDTAIEDLNEAIRLQPQETDLYINRAYLYYNVDNFFGAMSDYNYVLELDPQNSQAIFNRALLLTQVRDYDNAYKAFTRVLEIDPGNFHALYNRALIALDQGKYRQAQSDFESIARKYPRFYPVYYGIAQCRKALGDMRGAMTAAYHAENLVRQYVKNPKAHPLDRPMIARAQSNTQGEKRGKDTDGESDIEVMERFNQLVTVSSTQPQQLSYNERIKGRVQDRDINVEPEPAYMLSFEAPEVTLQTRANYFRELAELNGAGYMQEKVYLRPASGVNGDSRNLENLFKRGESLDGILANGNGRAVDYLWRGVVRSMLRNYEGAEADFSKALELNPGWVVAMMGRGYVRQMQGAVREEGDDATRSMMKRAKMQQAITDYDDALRSNPRLAHAWFNKGNIFYALQDYTSALTCYSEALRIDPEMGQAYYNRGLTYLQAGNRQAAFNDLGKAGELGVLPSYNILKRMK